MNLQQVISRQLRLGKQVEALLESLKDDSITGKDREHKELLLRGINVELIRCSKLEHIIRCEEERISCLWELIRIQEEHDLRRSILQTPVEHKKNMKPLLDRLLILTNRSRKYNKD